MVRPKMKFTSIAGPELKALACTQSVVGAQSWGSLKGVNNISAWGWVDIDLNLIIWLN